MTLLVTRPEPGASACKSALEALGHRVLADPLLRIALAAPKGPLDDARSLIVTSRYALDWVRTAPAGSRALPVFAVGPATARAARDMGFTEVHEGPGTAAGLAETIARLVAPGPGALAYLSGEHVAFDIEDQLARHGLAVRREIVYSAVTADRLSPATRAAMAEGGIGAVLLMSARTARTYVTLVMRDGLESLVRGVPHLCLSGDVGRPLEPLALPDVRLTAKPSSDAMIWLAGSLASKQHSADESN